MDLVVNVIKRTTLEGKTRLLIEVDENISQDMLTKMSCDGRLLGLLQLEDNRTATYPQIKLAHAMIADIAKDMGLNRGKAKEYLKDAYCQEYDMPTFSIGEINITQAREFTWYLMEHCFEHAIPFKNMETARDLEETRFLFLCLKYRNCWLCYVDHSQIAHVQTVGMGRDRRKIDHTKHDLMCLCDKHHKEQHNIGIDTFMIKYHIRPLRLNQEQMKAIKYG